MTMREDGDVMNAFTKWQLQVLQTKVDDYYVSIGLPRDVLVKDVSLENGIFFRVCPPSAKHFAYVSAAWILFYEKSIRSGTLDSLRAARVIGLENDIAQIEATFDQIWRDTSAEEYDDEIWRESLV